MLLQYIIDAGDDFLFGDEAVLPLALLVQDDELLLDLSVQLPQRCDLLRLMQLLAAAIADKDRR